MPTIDQAPPIASPLGNVRTARLDLRRFEHADLDELAEVFSHPEVWQFPYGRGFTRAETEAFLHSQIHEWNEIGLGCWLARTSDDGRIVGARVAERLGMELIREVTIPANERRGELTGLLYRIERDEWLNRNKP